MSFEFGDTLQNFLFKGWNASSITGVAWTCVAVGSMAVLLEGLKLLKAYLVYQMKASPLTYGKTRANISERSPLLAPLLLPPSIEHFRWRQRKFFIAQMLTHVIHLMTAYLLMLAVMSYNAWVLLAVVLGTAVGYFVFGAVRDFGSEEEQSELSGPHTSQTDDNSENNMDHNIQLSPPDLEVSSLHGDT